MSKGGADPRGLHAAGADAPAVAVLIVDDQATFCRAAGELIAATPGFVQVGEAASGQDAMELVDALHPDLVLLDVRLPGMDGIEIARRLASTHPEVVVVLISLGAFLDLPSAVVSAGAAGHIRKQDLSPGTLRDLWASYAPASARRR